MPIEITDAEIGELLDLSQTAGPRLYELTQKSSRLPRQPLREPGQHAHG